MKKLILVVLLAFMPLMNASAADVNYGLQKVDKVDRVYDGDTFYVTIKNWPRIIGQEMGIRIAGIDTPEVRGPDCEAERTLAFQAKTELIRILADAKKIELRNMYRGKYFRIIADVFADGQNVAELLIEKGYARPYDGGTRGSWCEQTTSSETKGLIPASYNFYIPMQSQPLVTL